MFFESNLLLKKEIELSVFNQLQNSYLYNLFSYLYLSLSCILTHLQEMALSATSPAYEGWKVSPLPLDFDIYLFNWTNPEDYYDGSPRKPRFEQLGPYRFRETPDKVDIVWHEANNSVSFRKKAIFHFDAEGSNGTLSDIITTVDTVTHVSVWNSFLSLDMLTFSFYLFS